MYAVSKPPLVATILKINAQLHVATELACYNICNYKIHAMEVCYLSIPNQDQAADNGGVITAKLFSLGTKESHANAAIFIIVKPVISG